MEEQINIDYLYSALKRRKNLIIFPALGIFAIAAVVVMLLPPVYKSSSTILVEAQEIPQEMVMSTVTGYVEERMQTITQIVLSRQNVLDMIEQFGLYQDDRDSLTPEELVMQFRESVSLEPIQADVINPRSGRKAIATIAFSLSFEGESPSAVAKVASNLTSLVLEENYRSRKEKAGTTFDFLQQQLVELQAKMEETEAKVAEFKDKHLQSLPEMVQANLSSMNRMEREIEIIRQKIMSLEDRKAYLEGQLALIDPVYSTSSVKDGYTSPLEELDALRRQYLSMSSRLSEKHPDMIAIKKQIEALEGGGDYSAAMSRMEADLTQARNQLASAEQKYTDKHPEVIMLRKKVEALEDDIADYSNRADVASKIGLANTGGSYNNPAYINLQTNITAAEQEIKTQKALLEQAKTNLEEFRRRIEETPRVEQEYLKLQRDYNTVRAKYEDTLVRFQAAKEAKGLEEGRIAEKLTIIEPPSIPQKPYKPERMMLLAVAFMLATATGLGSGGLVEYMDKSIHSAEEVSRHSHYPVLATVPYITAPWELARRRRRRLLLGFIALLAIAAAVAAVHFFYQPLDILWLKVLKALDM